MISLRPAVYISTVKDIDLYGLARDVGADHFRKIVKLCIMALFDEKYIKAARELAMDTISDAERDPRGSFLKGRQNYLAFRICIEGSNKTYRQCEKLLKNIKPRMMSFFLKTTVRQVLGPSILLRYFLSEGQITFHTNSFFIQPSFINPELMIKEDIKKPAKKQGKEISSGKEETDVPYEKTKEDIGENTKSFFVAEQPEKISATQTEPPKPVAPSDAIPADAADDDMDILDMLESML